MASQTREDPVDDVEISYEAETGLYTAWDEATGVASCGGSRSEALAMLAEALELHEGGGEAVTDEDLRDWGLDPDEFDERPLPEFLR